MKSLNGYRKNTGDITPILLPKDTKVLQLLKVIIENDMPSVPQMLLNEAGKGVTKMSKYLNRCCLVVAVFIFTVTCGKNETLSSEVMSKDYFFTTPDGRKITYTPVDSLIVIQFNNDVPIEKKQQIFEEFNLELLDRPDKKRGAIQSI